MIDAPVPRHERERRCAVSARLCALVVVAIVIVLALPGARRLSTGPGLAAAASTPDTMTTAGATADVSGPASAVSRPVRVERNDDHGLVLALSLPEATWVATAVSDSGASLWTLRLPGFHERGAPTHPRLPVWGAWIVVPPGTRPVVAPLAERWEPAAARRLHVGATPVIQRDPEQGELYLGEELLLPGESPRSGRSVAIPGQEGAETAARGAASERAGGPALVVSEPVRWRGRRVASVSVVPLAADPEGRASRLLREGRWEIRFEPIAGAMARQATAPTRSGRGDDHFGFLFLNPEGLRRWPGEPATAIAPRAKTAADGCGGLLGTRRPATLLGPEVRLLVQKTQLHRLSATTLRQRGLLPTGTVREDQIRVYQRRYNAADPAHYLTIEVPIHIVGDGGDFVDGESLLFYALRARDDGDWSADCDGTLVDVPGCGDPHEAYNGPTGASDTRLEAGNVYWLAFGDPPQGDSWSRMAEASLPPSSGNPLPRYHRVDSFEEDFGYQEWTRNADADRNHWNSHLATAVTVTLPLYAPDPEGMTGRVRADVLGASDVASRQVIVTLQCGENLLPIGGDSVDVSSLTDVVADTGPVIPGSALTAATATLRMVSSPVESPPSEVRAFLDWAELSYDALYRAVGDALVFPSGDGTGDRDLEVAGFTGSELGVVEITDPRRPVWVALGADNVVAAGGAFTLSLRVAQPTETPRRFIAQAGMAATAVTEPLARHLRLVDSPADPTQPSGTPDVLAVTHAVYLTGAQRWADYRRSAAGGGHDVHLVNVQDLYDWFSGGLKSPWAIQRFCAYALDHWGSWALLLVGDANENGRALGVTNSVYDWVPTHHHAQDVVPPPEVLAADKWFATDPDAVGPRYPYTTFTVAQMVVGRFPCNSESELATMIDKTLQVEADQAGQPWRRRAVFVADDNYSYGYGLTSWAQLQYAATEQRFRTSEDALATQWGSFANGLQEPQRFFLNTYLDPHFAGQDPRSTSQCRIYTETEATPPLLAQLTQGALLVHYQGHANASLLCHEILLQDIREALGGSGRRDVAGMGNVGKPWVFVGLGCHIADWAQNAANRTGEERASLAEKMLADPGAACASYASSGFEFLEVNADFAESQGEIWTQRPPRPLSGQGTGRTRWMLGELMLASEAATLALHSGLYETQYRGLAAQYCLLGDPLLMLDCGPPVIAAVLTDEDDAPVNDGTELAALDSTNIRRLRLTVDDEAGVDRVVVLDSAGNDLSAVVTEMPPSDPDSDQHAVYEIALPVRPFDHLVTLHVYDTADRTAADPHATLTVRLPLAGAFYLAGSSEPIVPGEVQFALGVPLDFAGVVTTAAQVRAGAVLQLTGDNLTVSDVQVTRRDARTLDLAFRATVTAGGTVARAVKLSVDGYVTTFLLQQGEGPFASYALGEPLAFPNPTPGPVSLLFRTNAPASPGRVRIFTVGGRPVVTLGFDAGSVTDGEGLVAWDGRDGEGDAVANGVYLYRVELDAPGGGLRSGMQRLVMMR